MELVALEALPPGSAYPLGPAGLTFGRAPTCNVVVDAEGVSARHCQIRATADGYLMEDLNSRNGTIVNGRLLAQPTTLHPGDLIVIGPALLEVRDVTPAGPSASADATDAPEPDNSRDVGAGDGPTSVAAAARAAAQAGRVALDRLGRAATRLAALESSVGPPPAGRSRVYVAVDQLEARRVLLACRRAAVADDPVDRAEILRREAATIQRVLSAALQLLVPPSSRR